MHFFGSKHFLPERFILSSIAPSSTERTVPDPLCINDSFLFWKVAVKSPLEIIFTWQVNDKNKLLRGCTMLSCDPKIKKVYHGNCLDASVKQSKVFENIVLPFHDKYARFLLGGMVKELEAKSSLVMEKES
uniref:Uncharacterized protein n=1 Tax=Helicotheca tamesis TaxID=374047 RepID=A0A7S2N1D2_9STRA